MQIRYLRCETIGGQLRAAMSKIDSEMDWQALISEVRRAHLSSAREQEFDKSVVTLVCSDGERGVAARGHRRRVDVSALVQQDPADVDVASRGRLHQRSEPRLRTVFHVRLPVKQKGHNLVTTLNKNTEGLNF